jgi:predicted enzyme related to lactoylglutathione lyase
VISLVLFAADVPRVVAFYAHVLDLEPREEPWGGVTLEVEASSILIHPMHGAASTDRGGRPREDAALKACFDVADLDRARLAVVTNGGSLTDRSFEAGAVTHLDVVDPEGNVLQLRARSCADEREPDLGATLGR